MLKTLSALHDRRCLLTRLRELVLDDEFPPGTALSEVRFADYFDVSRTPIREALKQLQIEGLVEIRPRSVLSFARSVAARSARCSRSKKFSRVWQPG